MFMHEFEVTVPDGAIVHRLAMAVTVPTRHVRVRHRMVELEPALDPADGGVPELAVPDDYEWDDFTLDEED